MCAEMLRTLASDCMSLDLRKRPKSMLEVLERVKAIKEAFVKEETNFSISLKGRSDGKGDTRQCEKCYVHA